MDSAGFVGEYTSIAISSVGRPIISYYDRTNGDLKVAHCNSQFSCFAATMTPLDGIGPPEDVGRSTNIVVNPQSGNPRISYHDVTNGNPKYALCSEPRCAAAIIRNVSTFGPYYGKWNSFVLQEDDVFGGEDVFIAYYSALEGLVFSRSISNFFGDNEYDSIIDCCDESGKYISVALGADRLPITSYYDSGVGDLRVVHCLSEDCRTEDNLSFDLSRTTVDRAGDIGQYSSIAIGSDGLPVIAYYDATNKDLKVAHCARAGCAVP